MNNNILIDTHSHLYDEEFDKDIDEVISRAISANVKKCILPGIDSTYFDRIIKFSQKYPEFAYPAIGLHPTSVAKNWKEELDFVKNNIDKYKFYAIGEIGLDGYWSKEFMEEQKNVFKEQIILSVEKNLPIIIHLREANEELFEVFNSLDTETQNNMRGVFHAYSGSFETYERIKKYGNFKFGIGGVLTYKNASIAKALEHIKLEDMLLETDCPWLTPVPHRGKRNESSYIPIIANKIAEIKNCSIDDIASATSNNAIKLFKI